MAAALVATAHDSSPRVVENAAESAIEHHLGMTCDPVAGYVQIPCIERCAFGAVKAWTAYAIASNELESQHRVTLDETITALAQTAKDMNTKYKETSEAGLGPFRNSLLIELSGSKTLVAITRRIYGSKNRNWKIRTTSCEMSES